MDIIKAGSFHYPPFSYVINGTFNGGVEVTILKEIAAALGKKVVFSTPSDGNLWGEIYSNGSLDGLMGDIHDGVVDVGFAQVR